jgi:oligopeptide transport system permease protein
MEIAPWAIIGTGLMLAITLLSLNFIGDGMRDALDPKDR